MPWSIWTSYPSSGTPNASAAAIAWARLRTLWLPRAGRSRSLVLHQEPGTPLVARVGLPLLEEDRDGPAELPGVQDLVIPVGPLDQPDRDRRPALAGPVGEGSQVRLGLGQVGLADDPDVGPVAELGLDEHGAEDVEGQVLVGVLLHVDVDDRRPSSRAVRRIGRSRCRTRSVVVSAWRASNRGVRLVSLSERLARGIGPRSSRSIWGISGSRASGAARPRSRSRQVCRVHVGLGLADDRLAQQVGGEGEPLAAELEDGLEGLVRGRAGDEPVRHVRRREPRHAGQASVAERPRGDEPQQPPRATGETRSPASSRYSCEVAADRLGRREGRHGVDEPEELDLDLGVAHGQVHQAVVPPGPAPERRAAADPGEQLAADLLGPALEGVPRRIPRGRDRCHDSPPVGRLAQLRGPATMWGPTYSRERPGGRARRRRRHPPRRGRSAGTPRCARVPSRR